MLSKIIGAISVAVWLGLTAAATMNWDALSAIGNEKIAEGAGVYFASGVVALCAIGAFLFHLVLLSVALAFAPEKDDQALSADQRIELAIRRAEAAHRAGRYAEAIGFYLGAQLYAKAMEIAVEIRDLPAQAQIAVKMRRYLTARKIYVQIQDYECAGHVSLLMNEVDAAREYYTLAAKALEEQNGTLERRASMCERAGDYATAARLYQQADEYESAAECYELMGDQENARRCEAQARALEAFERRREGLTAAAFEQRAALRKNAASQKAVELAAKGDFIEAGRQFRIAEKHMEAAVHFERAEEWLRAAKAYRQAGLLDRAEMAQAHAAPPPPLPTDSPALAEEQPPAPPAWPPHRPASGQIGEPAPDAVAIPSPRQVITATQFVPISQARAAPVYVVAGGGGEIDPEKRDEMFRMVRQGRLDEAARKAAEANDWLMAGAFLECQGELIEAADTYRKIGRLAEAAECLSRAGRPRQAAMIALAEGEAERAVHVLMDAVDAKQDPDNAALLLAEMLIDWGQLDECVALLRRKMAPEGIDPANANLFYRFGRLLERKRQKPKALEIYQDMLEAGAQASELFERIEILRAEKESAPDWRDMTPTKRLPPLAASAAARVSRLMRTEVMEITSRAAITPIRQKKRIFAFDPETDTEDSAATGSHENPTVEFSLFGAPPAKDQRRAASAEDPFSTANRYKLKRMIGQGGMGVVYEAQDLVLRRPVAIKLINERGASNPERLRQFLLEARAVAQLSHPNVVTIYDIGLLDMRHYIAMELVEGESLSARILREESLPILEAMDIFVQAARGLKAAHDAGVVHRDIKPGNILIGERGDVKIVDFGLARMQYDEDEEEDGKPFCSGTPGFISPEQARGEQALPASDIYALGVTLYYMLTGKPPFDPMEFKDAVGLIQKQAETELPSPRLSRPDTPEAMDRIFSFCAALDPEQRYKSIDEFLEPAENLLRKLQIEQVSI